MIATGLIVEFGNLSLPVFENGADKTHLSFQDCQGTPCIITRRFTPREEVEMFVQSHAQSISELVEMVRSYRDLHGNMHTYENGDVLYLLGHTLVLCWEGPLFDRLSEGGTDTLLEELDVALIHSDHIEDALVRSRAYHLWADHVFSVHVGRIIGECMRNSGIAHPHIPEIVIEDSTDERARLDAQGRILYIARRLEGYPSECVGYVFVAAVMDHLMPGDDSLILREATMEKAHIPWREAESLLGDSKSAYLRAV